MRTLHLARRLTALSSVDYRLLVRAYLRLAFVDLGLRLVGFRRLVAWIERRSAGVSRSTSGVAGLEPALVQQLRQYVRWLDVASRYHVVRARCLHQSLALHQWLREEGLASELRIGVLKDGNELKAHAWVEFEGHPVNDSPSAVAVFTPLRSMGAAPSERSAGGSGAPARTSGDIGLQSARWL
jgi:hypothetical protein